MNPGGGSGWDEPPLDIQIPDDARELDREVLAYHRELRAKRRRDRLRRLAGPLAGRATVMPLLASILAVCLVAGAMLSVATFSPATVPADQTPRPPTATSTERPAPQRSSSTARPAVASASGASASGASASGASASGTSAPATSAPARTARPRQRARGQQGEPLGEPFSLLDPAEPRPTARLVRAHLEPRVNPRRHDRYDFLPSDGS